MFNRIFKPFLPAGLDGSGPQPPAPLPVEPLHSHDPTIRKPDPDQVMVNARRAEALLKDPVLNAAFEDVANLYRMQWEHSTRAQLDLQQTAHLSLAALKDVRAKLMKFVADGKIWEANKKLKTTD